MYSSKATGIERNSVSSLNSLPILGHRPYLKPDSQEYQYSILNHMKDTTIMIMVVFMSRGKRHEHLPASCLSQRFRRV